MASTKKEILFKDRLFKGISREGYFKVSAVKTTDVVRTAQERHELSLLNTLLLGRTLTAAMLLASELKGEERLKLSLEGEGPVGGIVAEANRVGELRGYVQQPRAELDYSDPANTIEDGLGLGLLTVTKVLYNEAEPRHSTIELRESDVTTDVAHYLAQSEQVPSALLLDVQMDDDGGVSQAGGLLIQRLPGAPDEVLETLQNRLIDFPPIGKLLEQEFYIDEIMHRACEPYEVDELDKQQVHFFCRCNKDRFMAALSMLSLEDLQEMQGEGQEIVCHFCNEKVQVSASEVERLINEAQAKRN
ncbi:MAG: Hsp33 family molecular chaperone HslO [Balneolaceae bacterium]